MAEADDRPGRRSRRRACALPPRHPPAPATQRRVAAAAAGRRAGRRRRRHGGRRPERAARATALYPLKRGIEQRPGRAQPRPSRPRARPARPGQRPGSTRSTRCSSRDASDAARSAATLDAFTAPGRRRRRPAVRATTRRPATTATIATVRDFTAHRAWPRSTALSASAPTPLQRPTSLAGRPAAADLDAAGRRTPAPTCGPRGSLELPAGLRPASPRPRSCDLLGATPPGTGRRGDRRPARLRRRPPASAAARPAGPGQHRRRERRPTPPRLGATSGAAGARRQRHRRSDLHRRPRPAPAVRPRSTGHRHRRATCRRRRRRRHHGLADTVDDADRPASAAATSASVTDPLSALISGRQQKTDCAASAACRASAGSSRAPGRSR